MIDQIARAVRLSDEDLAVGTVLFRAHDQLRGVENQLELEATDPRVDEVYRQAKALRKAIAALLVEVAMDRASDALEEVVTAS